jgi:esterase FrsA
VVTVKKARWIIGLAVVILIILGVVFREPLILRVASVRPFVNDRFHGWVNMGVPEDELDQTLRGVHDVKGDGPGSWVYELSQIAVNYENAASEAEIAGNQAEAYRNWKTAAVYYYIARFPYLASPAKKAAYQKHIECYLKYAASFDPPLEVVEIPFEGKTIIGYLRTPARARPPVVVVTGGVDTWKSDIDALIEPLLAQGLAVFAMDIPGTGQSQWRLSPENDKVFSAVFDYLKTQPELNADRLGLYEMSFGGYYAIRLALTHPDVDAAVNVGGPIALAFAESNVKKVPDVMVATISHAMGVEQDLPLEQRMAHVEKFSLDRSGYLQDPRRTPPILSINGSEDKLVPIEDLYIITERGIKQDEWVYQGEGHCAIDVMDDWAGKAAVWMKEKLER